MNGYSRQPDGENSCGGYSLTHASWLKDGISDWNRAVVLQTWQSIRFGFNGAKNVTVTGPAGGGGGLLWEGSSSPIAMARYATNVLGFSQATVYVSGVATIRSSSNPYFSGLMTWLTGQPGIRRSSVLDAAQVGQLTTILCGYPGNLEDMHWIIARKKSGGGVEVFDSDSPAYQWYDAPSIDYIMTTHSQMQFNGVAVLLST